ncbi:MAG: hypothetical protein K1X85_07590 [Ignavibacteria bacterium]|nr:hypothetical protein [Ignavibacteria bacterium]
MSIHSLQHCIATHPKEAETDSRARQTDFRKDINLNRFIVSRKALTLLSVGLMIFLLMPPANAQETDACLADMEGWTNVDGTKMELSGTWFFVQSTDCKGNWQWSRTVIISRDNAGHYTARIGSETEMDVDVEGDGVVFERNLEKVTGKDNKGQNMQTWRGKLQIHQDGRIRVYGTWLGAFDYLIQEGFNKDFKLIKQ